MRIRMLADGRVLEGTAKQIAEAMHALAFGQENRTLSQYIDWAVDQARRMGNRAPAEAGAQGGSGGLRSNRRSTSRSRARPTTRRRSPSCARCSRRGWPRSCERARGKCMRRLSLRRSELPE